MGAPRRSVANRILRFGCIGLGVVGLVVVAIVGWAAIAVLMEGPPSGSGASSGGGSSSNGGASSAPAAPLSCKMSEPCDVGGASITVTRVTQDDELTKPRNHSYKGHWVIVRFDYTNERDKPGEADRLDSWRLKDSDGRTYTYAWERTIDHAVGWERDLGSIEGAQPGASVPGVVIFDTAPGAEDFTLEVRDLIRPRDSKTAEIPLTVTEV